MGKRKQATDEQPPPGAPAYMGQYASLMTILLSFFIVMLTMGQDRVAQFKVGVGLIRNLVGLTGATGVLDFWRTTRRPAVPRVMQPDELDDDAMLIGYERDMDASFSLDAPGVGKVDFKDTARTIQLRSTLRFEPGRERIDRATQFALDQAAAMLYVMDSHQITVGVLVDTGDPEADRMLAARRAVWLTRHLIEYGRIPASRIRTLGLVKTLADDEGDPTEVVFLLRHERR